MKAKPIPLAIRRAVHERSGGMCECQCGRPAVHIHHRKLRSQGGKHEMDNLLDLARECHDAAHANPERGYALGLLVPSWASPSCVPVTRGAA